DNKEYGPINDDQMRQWIAEGRANAQTQVLAEGTTQWKPLSEFPEFVTTPSGPPPAAAPGGIPAIPLDSTAALNQVSGPATALIFLAMLHFLGVALSVVMRFVGTSFFSAGQMPNQAFSDMFSGTLATISNLLGIVIAFLILMGGIKMKRLENYGLAMTAS